MSGGVAGNASRLPQVLRGVRRDMVSGPAGPGFGKGTVMRLVLLSALVCFALPALAEDKATVRNGPAQPVYVNVSYSINLPFDGKADGSGQEDRVYSKAMYARAAEDCADLLATIAVTCQLTNISVATGVSSYPGQPMSISVSANTTLQIELKP